MPKTNSRLKALRVLRTLTQAQLASKVGRSQSWVCGIERGQIQPSEVDIALICRALTVQPQAVFPVSDEAESDPLKVLSQGVKPK